MPKALRFGEVLEGIETLSLEDQEILRCIVALSSPPRCSTGAARISSGPVPTVTPEELIRADQEILRGILHRRIIERRREALIQDVQEAQQEFQAGQCRPATPENIMNEIVP